MPAWAWESRGQWSYHEATYPASRWKGARRVAVADVASPAYGGAERVELEEEIDTDRRTTVPAASDGAGNAR